MSEMTQQATLSTSAGRGRRAGGDLLAVFPFCLDHVGHGNIQRFLSLASYLAADGFTVDLVYQANPQLPVNAAQYAPFRHVHRVHGGYRSGNEAEINRRTMAFYAGHELPAAHLRPSSALTALVRSLLDASPYRAVLSTYAWTAPIFADLARPVLRVLDVQDILHEHADACRRATGASTTFSLPRATEEFLWRQWDQLIAISPEDDDRIRRDLLPGQRLMCVRHAVAPASAPSPGRDDVALYAGSDNVSNVASVKWLLEEVWPLVRKARPSARLRIAGLICRALSETAAADGVEVLGFKDDLRGEIESAGAIVAPYLYGSGLKIKVVEAACAGKAVVTTSAGLIGSGLEPARAIDVHDTPLEFASALAQVLGDADHRARRGAEALARAAALFAPLSCYGPVADAIRLQAPAAAAASAATIAGDATDRVALVCDACHPGRLLLWGNGGHTRSLAAALRAAGLTPTAIVETRPGVSGGVVEETTAIPLAELELQPDDLIVLSSQTFEHEMWADVAPARASGAWVLGLYDASRISRGLLERLSGAARTALGAQPAVPAAAAGERTTLVCDLSATRARWWRHGWLEDLAVSTTRPGSRTIVATPADLRPAAPPPAAPASVLTLASLERRPNRVESGDDGLRGIARLGEIAAVNLERVASLAGLGGDDELCLASPAVSECLGAAHVLRQRPSTERPRVRVHYCGSRNLTPPEAGVSDAERAVLLRLALSALADVTNDRLTLTASDVDTAGAVERLARRAAAVAPPGAAKAGSRAAAPGIVCFGSVARPQTRVVLEALCAAVVAGPLTGARVSWRSDLGKGEAGHERQWASGLSQLLDVELLDDADAASMLAHVAARSAWVVLHEDDSDEWGDALWLDAGRCNAWIAAPAATAAAGAIARGAARGFLFDTPGALVERLALLVPTPVSPAISIGSHAPGGAGMHRGNSKRGKSWSAN